MCLVRPSTRPNTVLIFPSPIPGMTALPPAIKPASFLWIGRRGDRREKGREKGGEKKGKETSPQPGGFPISRR